MKVYVLPVKPEFQPKTIPVIYPPHNKNFKDGEEVFFEYIQKCPDLITNNPNDADWHYLPIFWTHWMVSNKFGTINIHKLQQEVRRVIIDDKKTFTIYEYAEQPKVDIGKTIAFLGSRTSINGFDMPLLCSRHAFLEKPKKYLASFAGSLTTHPIRNKIKEKLQSMQDVLFTSGGGTEYFVNMMLESYISLCPRGYGGASYRFYEAMDLGTVPFLIGDIDHRPFKNDINWNEISFYTSDLDEIIPIISKQNKEDLISMGKKAREVYNNQLANGNWCKYAIATLESLEKSV